MTFSSGAIIDLGAKSDLSDFGAKIDSDDVRTIMLMNNLNDGYCKTQNGKAEKPILIETNHDNQSDLASTVYTYAEV